MLWAESMYSFILGQSLEAARCEDTGTGKQMLLLQIIYLNALRYSKNWYFILYALPRSCQDAFHSMWNLVYFVQLFAEHCQVNKLLILSIFHGSLWCGLIIIGLIFSCTKQFILTVEWCRHAVQQPVCCVWILMRMTGFWCLRSLDKHLLQSSTLLRCRTGWEQCTWSHPCSSA